MKDPKPTKVEELLGVRSLLEKTESTPDGIERLLSSLGHKLVPPRDQLLDSDALFQQKDLRDKIVRTRKLFSEDSTWTHPVTNQLFSREACIVLVEVVDERVLRSKWPFEITRYAVKFGFQTSQALFFFVSTDSRSFAVTAYTETLATPALVQVRRLVVDLDNITRTDLESLSALLYSRMRPDTIIEEFRNALPYLKVGQGFFLEYHDLFQLMTRRLRHVLGSEEQRYGYAQRLLGRIVFLYFLQRKGWLDGDRAYIKNRTRGLQGPQLFDFLYELFDILNTESNMDRGKGEIPYLNGSLFEREPYSNAQMRRISEACAPLILDILRTFDQYNFTISESTPLDKEVAVDPELLGSLFESMLPESERGEKGTFYTHQDEMLFMAREALRAYLSRYSELITPDQISHVVHGIELPNESRLESKIAREVKDRLREIRILDPAIGSGGFLIAAMQALLEARIRLNKAFGTAEQDYDAKLEIMENNLFGVDIEGEAIELARLRLWLTLVVDEPVENVRPLPNLDYNLHQGDSLRISEFDKAHQTRIDIDQTVRQALLSQIATTRQEYSKSHGKDKDAKRQQLESTLRKLIEVETGIKPPKVLPFSYKCFFADVMAEGGFDVILMNPPYITQEEIGKLPGQDSGAYKSEIVEDIRQLTGHKFEPNKQSDIAVYFHVRALTLLKEGGVAVVIATSKWLDVRYGIPLQEYLLLNSAIDYVYDSVDRSFSADVNTVITVVRRIRESARNNAIRFVYFKGPYRNVSGELLREIDSSSQEGIIFGDFYRMTIRGQASLYSDGMASVESAESDAPIPEKRERREHRGRSTTAQTASVYVGTKWGNLHLRAPAVYHAILSRGISRLKRLGEIYEIKRGITSGINDFFLLTPIQEENDAITCQNGFGYAAKLEARYCPHVVMRLPDNVTYELKENDLSLRIFICREEKSALRRTYALRYVEWGEKSPAAKVIAIQGKKKGQTFRLPEISSVQGRPNWYSLPDFRPVRVLLPQAAKNRHVVPLSPVPVICEHRFIGIYTSEPEDLWLYLNSAVFRLFMELNGRTEGAGALSVMVYEYEQCPVLNPIPPLSAKFKSLKQFRSRFSHRIVNIAETGPLEFESRDRCELDDLVLEQIGFVDPVERERIRNEIYQWLQERVRERLTKPKTAPESVIRSARRTSHDLREFQ